MRLFVLQKALQKRQAGGDRRSAYFERRIEAFKLSSGNLVKVVQAFWRACPKDQAVPIGFVPSSQYLMLAGCPFAHPTRCNAGRCERRCPPICHMKRVERCDVPQSYILRCIPVGR